MNDFMEKNYYEVLEITPGATLDEIHTAYKRAINTYHSESAAMYSILTEIECKEITNKIEEAYSVIGVSEKKIQYDNAKGFDTQPSLPRPSFKPSNDYSFKETNTLSVKDNSKAVKTAVQSKFALSYKVDDKFEKEIKNCSSFTGDFLRSIREYKDVSIQRMSDLTRVSKTHLKHIEDDLIEKLPADVYTRGFVYQYAKCLKLNPDLIATSYMNHTKELKKLLDA